MEYIFYVVYLLIIPVLFGFCYFWFAQKRELKAKKMRTPIAKNFIIKLGEPTNVLNSLQADNDDIDVNVVKFDKITLLPNKNKYAYLYENMRFMTDEY